MSSGLVLSQLFSIVHSIIQSTPKPQSPCPELLFSNVIPSNSQIQVINRTIETVEEDICGLDAEIASLQQSAQQLMGRRTELKHFVRNHRGAVSVMRRIPSDVLVEIFLRCLDPNAPLGPPYRGGTLESIVQVCGRWRTIAMESPQLWRHFDIQGNPSNFAPLTRKIRLQLGRSRQIPICITLDTRECEDTYPTDILDLFLRVSARWQDIRLSLSPAHYMHLFASTCDFPVLKRLALICWDQLDWSAGDVIHFFSALPALEELLEFPWAWLRKCTLTRCDEDMILRILPLLAPDAHFSSMVFGPARISIGNVQSPIGALALDSCYKEPVAVFCSLTAPSLKELAITTYIESPSQLAFPLLSFLGRSACTLTSLCLRTSLAEHDLLTISRVVACAQHCLSRHRLRQDRPNLSVHRRANHAWPCSEPRGACTSDLPHNSARGDILAGADRESACNSPLATNPIVRYTEFDSTPGDSAGAPCRG
ncbi:hypothetical protein DFH08DRAFT_270719, partial [Mycena albidolilacea]